MVSEYYYFSCGHNFFDLATNSVVENISNPNPYVVGNLLNPSAVNNAAAIVILGGGDDIDDTMSVDDEASESEEEEDAETTVEPPPKILDMIDVEPPNNDDLKPGNKIISSKNYTSVAHYSIFQSQSGDESKSDEETTVKPISKILGMSDI